MAVKILSDDYLVRVKAQVMTRDDSTGGWVPMGGGGMSIVGLRKLVIASGDDIRHEYLIHGERIADQSVVLNCVLKKDVQYTKANPTFHHWKTEEKRFGLTFQSSADARAFDKGVKRAVEDLLEGSPESNDLEVGDDEVFMTLDLPLVSRKDSSSQSASTASTTTSSPSPQSPALSSPTIHPESVSPSSPHVFTHTHSNHHYLHRVHYITKSRQSQPNSPIHSQHSNSTKSKSSIDSAPIREDIWLKPGPPNDSSDKIKSEDSTATDDNIEIVDNSYVQFENRSSAHDYSYPTIESVSKGSSMQSHPLPSQPSSRRESISSMKKHNLDMHPPLPTKSKRKKKDWLKREKRQNRHLLSQRSRCVFCHEMFIHEENHRGACEDAPDKMAICIEKVSCICCAKGMLYHCMADSDGDFSHPCVCDNSDGTNCKKWTALTVLSLLVPCLWCYWPLTACHRCGAACGCCGGRHRAA